IQRPEPQASRQYRVKSLQELALSEQIGRVKLEQFTFALATDPECRTVLNQRHGVKSLAIAQLDSGASKGSRQRPGHIQMGYVLDLLHLGVAGSVAIKFFGKRRYWFSTVSGSDVRGCGAAVVLRTRGFALWDAFGSGDYGFRDPGL